MKRWWAAWCVAALVVALSACVDEDKTVCRVDGDCAGLKACRDGACVLPDEFGEGGLEGPGEGSTGGGGAGRDQGGDAGQP